MLSVLGLCLGGHEHLSSMEQGWGSTAMTVLQRAGAESLAGPLGGCQHCVTEQVGQKSGSTGAVWWQPPLPANEMRIGSRPCFLPTVRSWTHASVAERESLVEHVSQHDVPESFETYQEMASAGFYSNACIAQDSHSYGLTVVLAECLSAAPTACRQARLWEAQAGNGTQAGATHSHFLHFATMVKHSLAQYLNFFTRVKHSLEPAIRC